MNAPVFIDCQRWNRGRASYRPAGEVFDHSRAAVHAIDEATAKAFVEAHHYSRSYPAARCRVGLFQKDAFHAERLLGVAVFSVPMNQQVIPAYFDCEANAGVELGRFVLLDEAAANAETWFLARAFRVLRKELKDVRGIVSYCDPLPRVNADGSQVKPGHTGTIYRAHNGSYRGTSCGRTLMLSRDGRVVSQRALSKIRKDDQGAAYATRQLQAMGAPPRLPLESGSAYVNRALAEGQFRQVRHPGNHVFTWKVAA